VPGVLAGGAGQLGRESQNPRGLIGVFTTVTLSRLVRVIDGIRTLTGRGAASWRGRSPLPYVATLIDNRLHYKANVLGPPLRYTLGVITILRLGGCGMEPVKVRFEGIALLLMNCAPWTKPG